MAAGSEVQLTTGRYNYRRGTYRIVVHNRTVRSRPRPIGGLGYPGLLVGEARVRGPQAGGYRTRCRVPLTGALPPRGAAVRLTVSFHVPSLHV